MFAMLRSEAEHERKTCKQIMFTELRSEAEHYHQHIRTIIQKLLPSWGGLTPVPPELPESSELPVPEEEPETDSEGDSEYETALVYQNNDTRWYSAIWRFLFWKKQDWFLIKANPNETLQETHKGYNEKASAIAW
ncbi:hypothetical protein RclHR1_00640024 [Rhizophagus clarus]|uniref:Uncharacterized protein n=1 Tax=Rhizophagus clarus TaxID=94130 RepID=A0A2Z6RS10_9GLOM|nr:hypothetical protein RclHR1_00640021 [Rhizophagus clarus]GBC05736.1 hypothetical protein RclHR1_00640024 [Rhizophagus clarus]